MVCSRGRRTTRCRCLDLRCEIGNGLARRVSSAYQDDVLAGTKSCLDGRCPVGNAGPFQLFDVGNVRLPVTRSRSDHDGARPRSATVAELEGERGFRIRSVTAEQFDGQRNSELGAELRRLIEGPAREGLSRNAGRKAEIIFDPGGCARLAAEGAAVQDQDRQPFGCAIDGSGKPGRAGPNDRYVMYSLRIKIRCDAETGRGIRIARASEHCTVRADHQRQIFGIDAEPFDQFATLCLACGNDGVGVAVAGEKS